MYAVIRTGGKQYLVGQGDFVKVEKLPGDVGQEVVFEEVLLVNDGSELKLGKPVVEGVRVRGTIVEQGRDKKIIVFKMKRRKGYRRKQGHRQHYTGVKVEAIETA
ncbi:50S ribosomal protein L21 [Deferrisoma camini]|uniref:50S ribosomal protein L21 n=1 Tax=Deferrisoma camini TaxID=1035120 RepID=UPI00046D2D5F|nr:50S ribosomal protein L21 [Deferrisoma camini]